jgi:hypothetical protein
MDAGSRKGHGCPRGAVRSTPRSAAASFIIGIASSCPRGAIQVSRHRPLLIAVLLLAAAGCTTSPPHVTAHQPGQSIAAEAATRKCTVQQVKTAIVGLFRAWNHRQPAGFGGLFDSDAAFAFPGKKQDSLTQGPNGYTEVGGRSAIIALAERQWAQGEFLMFRDVVAVAGGSPEGNGGGGGGATVVARFPDGTTQPMDEVKFIYDCASHAFAHVVMTSAMAARHAARPWSWRMP